MEILWKDNGVRLVILCVLLCLARVGYSGDAVNALRFEGDLVIDGRLDESVWQVGQEYHIRYSLSGRTPDVDTWFKVCYDDEALYLAFWCQQPDMDSLMADYTHRDQGIWNDDCVEIFLDPAGNGKEYYQFVINSIGALFDARRSGASADSFWNAVSIKTGAFVGQDFWSVEVCLPFANVIGSADTAERVSADTWRLNIAREYRGGGARLLTYCDLTNYFDYTEYAPLTGIELDYVDKQLAIQSITQEKLSRRDNVINAGFSVNVINATQADKVGSMMGQLVWADGTAQEFVIDDVLLPAGREGAVTFDVLSDNQTDFTVVLQLVDRESGTLLAGGEYDMSINVNPLRVQISHPYYRSAIYATMNIDEIELDVASNWALDLLDGDQLAYELRDEQGNVVAQDVCAQLTEFWGAHRLAIPDLPYGDYDCVVSFLRDGKPLYESSTTLHVYPPSISEVRVNEYLNFVINGQEFFPVGTFHNPWYGSSISSFCNTSISYSPAVDLNAKPDRRDTLFENASKGRYMTFFPHTKRLWPHIVDGKPELAKRPLSAEDAEEIGKNVAQYQQVPGLLAWYMADEPSPHTFLTDYLQGLCDTIGDYDPYHPAYISYNRGGTAAAYASASDALGVHWYPGFTDRGMNYPMVSIAENMDAAREAVDNKQAIVFSPQLILLGSSGAPDIRPITHQESRCMAYLSIVHGAKGIIWFSTGGLKSSIEIRIGMPFLASELQALDHVFLAHDEPKLDITGNDAQAVHCLAKNVDGELYIIAVNTVDAPVSAEITLPAAWGDAKSLTELASDNRECRLADGAVLACDMDSYQVRIFTTDKNAAVLPSQQFIAGLFKQQEQKFLAEDNLCYRGRGADVTVSEDYGNLGMARLAIDGYTDFAGEIVRKAAQGSWLRVDFAEPATVAQIHIFTGPKYRLGALRDYHLEVLSNDRWMPVKGDPKEIVEGDNVQRVHALKPTKVQAIRLVMDKPMAKAGYLYEIKAYPPKQ